MTSGPRTPSTICAPLLALWAGCALAEAGAPVTVQQLQEALAERDAIIIDLLNRVRELEASNTDRIEVTPSFRPESPAAIATENVAPGTVAPSDRPADFAIDTLAAERALERSLIQRGSRLLYSGQLEIAPAIAYSRFDDRLAAAATDGGGVRVANADQSADIFDASVAFRYGLPLDAQLELHVPYRIVHRESTVTAAGVVLADTRRTGSGTGDLSAGLAVQLLDADGWRPNLVGRVLWRTGTGEESADSVALGGGIASLGSRLSAYWRQDPLVFLFDAGYTHYYDADGPRPGDSVDLALGISLAVSPETALTFSLEQNIAKEFEMDGRKLPGTDRLSSVFNISAAAIIGRGTLLRVDAGIGLTDDAPDYRLSFTLPMRM